MDEYGTVWMDWKSEEPWILFLASLLIHYVTQANHFYFLTEMFGWDPLVFPEVKSNDFFPPNNGDL